MLSINSNAPSKREGDHWPYILWHAQTRPMPPIGKKTEMNNDHAKKGRCHATEMSVNRKQRLVVSEAWGMAATFERGPCTAPQKGIITLMKGIRWAPCSTELRHTALNQPTGDHLLHGLIALFLAHCWGSNSAAKVGWPFCTWFSMSCIWTTLTILSIDDASR